MADGVGSAARSEQGSLRAVTALAEFCSQAVDTYSDRTELLKDGFTAALGAVNAKALEEQTELSELILPFRPRFMTEPILFSDRAGRRDYRDELRRTL